jgi:hypothetical protein
MSNALQSLEFDWWNLFYPFRACHVQTLNYDITKKPNVFFFNKQNNKATHSTDKSAFHNKRKQCIAFYNQ